MKIVIEKKKKKLRTRSITNKYLVVNRKIPTRVKCFFEKFVTRKGLRYIPRKMVVKYAFDVAHPENFSSDIFFALLGHNSTG